ncbi:amidohydrolase family protein [Pedobacter sp. HMF7647]|uniref:Amidohydrolase family protein n=1 Tax=Hufsiella arboris TaxID=2695275 RepID=A0A7K1YAW9_9SPHI|nr:amidohydrolase family protein [Hufsiella arboris]MXV51737.1 amidohydrolase family protein [Hufsiella arboris]
MAKYYSADYIMPVSGPPIKNGVVAVNDDGIVIDVLEKADHVKPGLIVKEHGIIVPGLVNSHCHLELSHLRGRFAEKQGLVPFLKEVISSRGKDDDGLVLEHMQRADEEMYNNGIVVVGDVSNRTISKSVKEKSKIHYHTYVESIGFDPAKAKEVFQHAVEMVDELKPLRSSIVPHAPYSVSKELLRYITHFCSSNGNPFCIHNQETDEENQFYRYKTGAFLDFYKDMGLELNFFKSQARNSLQTLLRYFPDNKNVMLVHNTYTSLKDIYFIQRMSRNINWCFCPKANLFIEGRLPKLDLFLMNGIGETVQIGTDSLASNDELNILSELKVLHQHFPTINFSDSIKWVTLNGARFLKVDHRFGSIEKGKQPGLNLISHVNGLNLTEHSTIKRLI